MYAIKLSITNPILSFPDLPLFRMTKAKTNAKTKVKTKAKTNAKATAGRKSKVKAGLKSSKTKNVVDTSFVAESPEGFKKRLVTAANQQLPYPALVCWGQRNEKKQVFSDDSELAARNELLIKPLRLYNTKVLEKIPERVLGKLHQGLGDAVGGAPGPKVAILNTESLNPEGFGRSQPGGRNYTFPVTAFGESKGSKTMKNEVELLNALSQQSQSQVCITNLFQWVLSNKETSSVNHNFGTGGDSFAAGLATVDYLRSQGISVFIGRGKTIGFYKELVQHLSSNDNVSSADIVMTEMTPIGPVDLEFSIVYFRDTEEVLHILTGATHGSQMHKLSSQSTIAAQYAFGLRAAGTPLSTQECIAMSKALVGMSGTSYINGDERKKLHEQNYIVKSGKNKGKLIKSYPELGE